MTIDRKRKLFHDKAKFKQFLSTNPTQKNTLEAQFQSEEQFNTPKWTQGINNLRKTRPKRGKPTA